MKLFRLALTAAAALSITACGVNTTGVTSARVVASSSPQTQAVPPQSAFNVIKCEVVKLLPDDNVGLPHQNFVVQDTAGRVLTVNHDTKFGKKVQGLKVGQKLTIRGVEYHDAKADGIHWTHKAKKAGDAGYIETAEGVRYE